MKTEATDYLKPVRPALYTEKRTVPTEVSASPLLVGRFFTGQVCCGIFEIVVVVNMVHITY